MTSQISDADLREILVPLLRRRTCFVTAERPAGDTLLATRFGGRPAGRRGESWPICMCGEPLQFVGQVSGGDAPLVVSWFQLATVFQCATCVRYGDPDFTAAYVIGQPGPDPILGSERPWPGWCIRAYPASRADDDAMLVYADWLQTRGDLNGELIVLARALATARDPVERRVRHDAVTAFLLANPALPRQRRGRAPGAAPDEIALLAIPIAGSSCTPRGSCVQWRRHCRTGSRCGRRSRRRARCSIIATTILVSAIVWSGAHAS
ncbi:MAG: hypothetical protein WKG01_18915 [Kofleriaceae bacterium]